MRGKNRKVEEARAMRSKKADGERGSAFYGKFRKKEASSKSQHTSEGVGAKRKKKKGVPSKSSAGGEEVRDQGEEK